MIQALRVQHVRGAQAETLGARRTHDIKLFERDTIDKPTTPVLVHTKAARAHGDALGVTQGRA